MAVSSILDSSSITEQQWINQIKKIVDGEVKIDIDVPVSIFRVPSTLSASKPEAYMPRLIGMGPFHHLHPQLYEMERHKLAASCRLQKQFKSLEFEQLVEKLMEIEYQVRASYHKYLELDGDTLMWIMAIDGLFLLDFLYAEINNCDTFETAEIVDSTERKLSHDSILTDIMMLENQIPIFLLTKILYIQCSSADINDNSLPSMLMTFCESISPIQLKHEFPLHQVVEQAHLLDLLYHLIVPKLEVEDPPEPSNVQKDPTEVKAKSNKDSGNSCQIFTTLCNKLSNVKISIPSKITKPVKKVIDCLEKIITKIPGVSNLASKYKENIKPENGGLSDKGKKHPKVEKIMIPSASHLHNIARVKFCPTTGDISTIKFDLKEKRFYLPIITLNVHSEVIMRNLVAYEAAISPNSLGFARYIQLLNAIMLKKEDAKLLRKNKIIVNRLKSDDEVLQLFNGISKSIRLSPVPYIDKAIEDANKYFNSSRKVMTYRFMKDYVYGSWRFLTVVVSFLVVALMALQSFCSIYSCPGNVSKPLQSQSPH